MQDLVPWPRIEPGPPALGAWSLSHWTTREVPNSHLNSPSSPTFPSLTPLLVLSDIPFPHSYMHSNLRLRVCLRIAQLNTALSSLLYSILTPTHISPLKEKPLKLGEVCFLTHICLAQEPIPWGLVHLDLRSLSLPFCKTGLFPFTSPSTYRCLCPDSKSSTALLV